MQPAADDGFGSEAPSASVKVLFIAGWGRSGSTILSKLLGQIPGFLSVGEIRFIWDRGLLRESSCACTRSLRECPVWREAVSFLIEESREEIERLRDIRDRFKTRHLLRHAIGRRELKNGRLSNDLSDYVSSLAQVYRGLQGTTGCRVIVDSSKYPSHGFLIDLIPDVDLRILHLVRDPRAVAFSWQRKRLYEPAASEPKLMNRHGGIRSSLQWVLWNAVTEYWWSRRRDEGRYMRLSYEEFAQAPRKTIIAVRDFVGESAAVDFFSSSHTATLQPTHELSGNPSRFQSGAVDILADSEWIEKMRARDRMLVSALTGPMLARYGYRARKK